VTVGRLLLSTFTSALRHWPLWLLQFLGNAPIIVISGLWVLIGDAHIWQLVLSFLIAMLIIAGALVLHGGTMNYYVDLLEERSESLEPALRRAFKHLLPLAIWAAVFFCVLYLGVSRLDGYRYSFPGYLRSEFPAWLRRLMSEQTMDNLYAGFVAFVRWVVTPGLLLPFGLSSAQFGFRGLVAFRDWARTLRNLAYWLVLVIASLMGVYVVHKILGWTLNEETATLGEEKIWLGFRMLVAYLLALYSWLIVCFMLAQGPHRPDPAAAQKAAA
jgi:hypothetical protein